MTSALNKRNVFIAAGIALLLFTNPTQRDLKEFGVVGNREWNLLVCSIYVRESSTPGFDDPLGLHSIAPTCYRSTYLGILKNFFEVRKTHEVKC